MDSAKQGALAGLRQELETTASAQMAEAESEWQRTMTERESALQAEKQAELESAEQRWLELELLVEQAKT